MARIPKIEEQEHPDLQALVNEIRGKRGRRISDWNHRVSPTAEMAREDFETCPDSGAATARSDLYLGVSSLRRQGDSAATLLCLP